mgnify:CR=1 FL=1
MERKPWAIMVPCGWNSATSHGSAVVERYAAIADAWATRTSSSTTRTYTDGYVLRGMAFVVGGVYEETWAARYTNERWNDTANSVTARKTLATASGYGGSCSIRDHGYICNGLNWQTKMIRFCDIANAWTTRTSYGNRFYNCAGSARGFLFNEGGSASGHGRFDDIANTWTERTVVNSGQTPGIGANGFFMIGNKGRFCDIANAWTSRNWTNTRRGAVGYLDGRYYCAGYAGDLHDLQTNRYCDIADTTTLLNQSMSVQRKHFTGSDMAI